MVRYLVVTADDFGYCSERNRGIVAGYLAGGITRTSLLVTAAAAKQAAHLAAQHRIPLGLHFNVTEGFPVADAARVLSLLTATGVFKGKNGFRDAVSNGHVNLEEVKVELEAQLARFRALTGHLPLYVDGHNHTHVLPGLSCVFAAVLSDAGIRSARMPCEVALQSAASWLLPPARMAFYRDVVREASAAATVFTQHGIRFSDGFVGMATMGADMTVQRLESLLHETYHKLAVNGTAPTGKQQVSTEDVNCDRRTEGVKPGSDRPPCDDVHPRSSQITQPDSGTGTTGVDTKTLEFDTDCQKVETETQWLRSETDIWGRLEPDSRRAASSPCDKDKVGERHDDDNKSGVGDGVTGSPGGGGDGVTDSPGGGGDTDSAAVVVELMVHPGYPCVDPGGGCGVGPDDFAQSAERSEELGILCSHEWRTVCDKYKLTLCAQPPACRARC